MSSNSILEGDSVMLSGSFSDPDVCDTHVVLIDWGDDSISRVEIAAGVLSFSEAHRYLDDNPSDTPADDYQIRVTVQDQAGAVTSDAEAYRDDFEDNSIDATQWAYGGRRRGWGGDLNGGSWQWDHTETVYKAGNSDGYLELRVGGPGSGNTYGAEAWIRTTADYNDGRQHVVNFTWEPEFVDPHYNAYYIQVTDGWIDPMGDLHWNERGPYLGTVNLYRHYFDEHIPGGPVSPGPLAWSIVLDPSGVARLYEGPDGTGTLRSESSLSLLSPWYLRFMLVDGTSAGFPPGDARLNLYSVSSTTMGGPSDLTVTVNNVPPTVNDAEFSIPENTPAGTLERCYHRRHARWARL